MVELPPGDLSLADLIRVIKGDPAKGGLRYEDLEARSPIDPNTGKRSPGLKRLEQFVNKPMKSFPDPQTIKNLSITLRVSEQVIVDACCVSLGIKVNRRHSRLEMLLPPGVDDLDDAAISAFVALLGQQVAANKRITST